MSGRRIISTKEIAERLCLAEIDLPGGYVLKGTALKIDTPTGGRACITAEFILFGPEPAPAVETRPGESPGGFIVPTELEDAVRTGLQIIGQPVTVRLEPERSDWIDGSVKPTMVGWYERNYTPWLKDETVLYAFWNGTAWGTSRLKPVEGREGFYASMESDIPWRGLRHDPTRGHAS